MTETTCGGCRFCEAFEANEDETPAGICRRNPPSIDGDGSSCFPTVYLGTDWCGEFLKRPVPRQHGPAEV